MLWLLALVLFLAAGWFFLQSGTSQTAKGTHLVEDRDFKVSEPESISKIFLADRRGNQTTLEKKEDIWMVNGDYPANENAIKNILDAVGRIEMQFIPAKAAVPNIVKSLATEGILVELFGPNGKKVRGYYIGGATSDERGTYAIMEGADQPYVVHLPGWVGNIRFRFNLVGEDWRSKRLFATPVEDIARLSIEYPTQRNRSFILTPAGENYEVAPFYETDQPVRLSPRSRVERYLYQYEKLYISEFENTARSAKAELIQGLPFAVISLDKVDGSEQVVKVYARIGQRTITVDPKDGTVSEDTPIQGYDLLFNDDKDFAVIQTGDLQPYLMSYQSF